MGAAGKIEMPDRVAGSVARDRSENFPSKRRIESCRDPSAEGEVPLAEC